MSNVSLSLLVQRVKYVGAYVSVQLYLFTFFLLSECEHIYYNDRQPSTVNIRNLVTSGGDKALIVLPCSPKEVGWVLIQQRVDSSVDFSKSFDEFSHSFGTPDGNYWAGLSYINNLIGDGARLQIYLESFDATDNVAVIYYDEFRLTDITSKFKLKLGPSQSPLSSCLVTKHKGREFRGTSVLEYKRGWWNQASDDMAPCCNLNGIYREDGIIPHGEDYRNTIFWNSFKDGFRPLKRVQMSLLPLNYTSINAGN